jgi:uncharacterized membrane protein (UPF0127 family)
MCILRLLSKGLEYERRAVLLNGKRLHAIIADTPRKMTVGLMFRQKLKDNECMLFEFPAMGSHPIWMKNMMFPIDIIWCGADGRIVYIVQDAQPLTKWWQLSGYTPDHNSKYVIELNSGFVRKNKIKKGMKVSFT